MKEYKPSSRNFAEVALYLKSESAFFVEQKEYLSF